jgi:hypothetical protein
MMMAETTPSSTHDPLHAAAADLIAKHGDAAFDYASDRANDAVRHSDVFSSAMWKKLREAIEQQLTEQKSVDGSAQTLSTHS